MTMGGTEVVTILEGWLDSHQAQAETGYTVRYLCQLAREGRIEATKVGRDWLFNRESLLAWREEMERMGTKKHRPQKAGGDE